MSLVEKKYSEALHVMGGIGRVQRTCSLFKSFYEMLRLQISKDFPDLSERALRKKIAERLYMSDPNVQALLKKVDVD